MDRCGLICRTILERPDVTQRELARCLEVALGTNHVIEFGLVDLAVVCDDQAQAGGAVRRRDDVARAADRLQNLACRFCIVQSHVVSLSEPVALLMKPFS